MGRTVRLAIAGLLLAATAAPVLAAPSALIRCDGYGRRQTPGEQVGRGILILGTLGLFGSAEADNPSAREAGEKGITACTEALSDSRTTGNPVRRAEVLMMRGVRQFEMGRFDDAIADARAARSVELTPLVRAHFDRTLGSGTLLLEALARLSQNNQADAEKLAFQAAQARPTAHYMAEEALRIMALTPEITPEEKQLHDRIWLILPNLRPATALEAAGDWAGAAANLKVLVAQFSKPGVVILAHQAAVQALSGDTKGAEETLAKASQDIDELAAKAGGTDQAAQTAAQQVARADEMVQLAKAQIALNQGKIEEAKGLLAGRSRWLSPPSLTAQIIANVQAKGGPGTAPGIDPAKIRSDATKVARDALTGKGILNLLVTLLPHWEDPSEAQEFGKMIAPTSKAMQPKPTRDGAATGLSSFRTAAIDTVSEAMLVAAARATAAKGQDRFAVLMNFISPGSGRPGLVSRFSVFDFVTPADALFAAQASRAIKVADIEATLGAQYKAPEPAKR
jgi:intracellular sulfur oxidation DsrE/DsrF family protein